MSGFDLLIIIQCSFYGILLRHVFDDNVHLILYCPHTVLFIVYRNLFVSYCHLKANFIKHLVHIIFVTIDAV
jgi:hypothetical protein